MSYDTDDHALPYLERPDLSPFIVHLTRRSDDASAYANLVQILRTGEIMGSGGDGFVKGPSKAACFMDIPLGSLKYVLNKANSGNIDPRYEPYGVVVSKGYAYDHGCRPVLYLSEDERETMAVPRTELWRVVRFEGVQRKRINWTHEREWRAKDRFELPSKLRAVLVKNTKAAERLASAIAKDKDGFESIPASIIPLTVLCQGLPYLD